MIARFAFAAMGLSVLTALPVHAAQSFACAGQSPDWALNVDANAAQFRDQIRMARAVEHADDNV